MAAMLTSLTVFDTRTGARTSVLDTHTVQSPKLVIESRKVADGNKTVAEYKFALRHTTVDAEGAPLKEKIVFEAVARIPILGNVADVATALGVYRDIIASDEFENSVDTQEWLVQSAA